MIYTVFALGRMDGGEFMVAGVVEGQHPAVDSEPTSGAYHDWQRLATSVEAAHPDDAEAAAVAEFRRNWGLDEDYEDLDH